MIALDIRNEVARLKRYYKTDDPFEVIAGKKILLLNEELGSYPRILQSGSSAKTDPY